MLAIYPVCPLYQTWYNTSFVRIAHPDTSFRLQESNGYFSSCLKVLRHVSYLDI